MKLGMGMMRLPLLDENDFTSIDYEQLWMQVSIILTQHISIMTV